VIEENDYVDMVYVFCALNFGWRPEDVDRMSFDFVMKLINAYNTQVRMLDMGKNRGVQSWHKITL
jgi:hypothetical protein